jgi:hypothetical protein
LLVAEQVQQVDVDSLITKPVAVVERVAYSIAHQPH